MLTAVARGRPAAGTVMAALRFVEGEQMSTGEIANYRRTGIRAWEYCFSPLASAVAHDALGVLDPLSAAFDAQALEHVADDRSSTARLAVAIRRKIRRFLAWQQRSDGTWRFFGHGSLLPSDLETTACACAALLDDAGVRAMDEAMSTRAATRFARRGGLFSSPGSRGDRMPDPCLEHAANVHLLRSLVLNGTDRLDLDAALAAAWPIGDVLTPRGLWLLYAVGRLIARSPAMALEQLARAAVETQSARDDGSAFVGPFSSALWLSAVIDFGPRTAVAAAADRVRHWMSAPHRARIEAVADDRCSGPGLTTAVAIASLARAISSEDAR